MARIFAWHRTGLGGRTVPVLWETEIPSFAGSDYKAIVARSHPLTEEDEEMLRQTNRSPLDALAERYPRP